MAMLRALHSCLTLDVHELATELADVFAAVHPWASWLHACSDKRACCTMGIACHTVVHWPVGN